MIWSSAHKDNRMARSFISYSHQDSDKVTAVVTLLKDFGYDFWMDTSNLVGGEDWKRALSDNIKLCDLVLFFVSNASLNSPWCTTEIMLAMHEQKTIIPILLAPIKLPLHLAHLQYVDLTINPQNVSALIRAINAQVTSKTSAPRSNEEAAGKSITINGNVTAHRDVNIG
jgi:hypothetical protein